MPRGLPPGLWTLYKLSQTQHSTFLAKTADESYRPANDRSLSRQPLPPHEGWMSHRTLPSLVLGGIWRSGSVDLSWKLGTRNRKINNHPANCLAICPLQITLSVSTCRKLKRTIPLMRVQLQIFCKSTVMSFYPCAPSYEGRPCLLAVHCCFTADFINSHLQNKMANSPICVPHAFRSVHFWWSDEEWKVASWLCVQGRSLVVSPMSTVSF